MPVVMGGYVAIQSKSVTFNTTDTSQEDVIGRNMQGKHSIYLLNPAYTFVDSYSLLTN